jgi:hypothetical protein
MKRFLLLILFFQASLTAGIPVQDKYLGPTEQLVKRESWNTIQKNLNKIKIPNDLIPFFDTIASNENWGHIGYHGATQDYRIYQDIIRLTVEEILGIPIRKDFQFLRIPGDSDLNLNSMDEFINYWGEDDIDNKTKLRSKQLISLNYGIYSNFDHKGSCSISLFVKDKSKSELDYAKQLNPLFENLGISTGALKELFRIAHKRLDGDGGILLRLSESSHLGDPRGEAYNFADEQSYPCKRGGYRWGSHLISKEFEHIMSKRYITHDVKIAPQLRLLVNNANTLNPYSSLSVERWDLYDTNTLETYEAEMRDYISNLKYSSFKVEKYKDKLMKIWSED